MLGVRAGLSGNRNLDGLGGSAWTSWELSLVGTASSEVEFHDNVD